VDIDCGYQHCACVSQKGGVYTWGQGEFFQLGHGSNKSVLKPKLVKKLEGIEVVQVSCSNGEKYNHTGVVDKDGKVYTWGSGYKGKLGHADNWSHSDSADEKYPKQIDFVKDTKVKEIVCGGIHTAILTEMGEVLTFGCGSDGRIGHPECEGHRYLYKEGAPRKIEAFNEIKILSLSSSYYHMLASGE